MASALKVDEDHEDPEEEGSAAPGSGLARIAAEIDIVRRRSGRQQRISFFLGLLIEHDAR